MKCAEIQRACLENDGSTLPAPVLEHLIGCAECRKAYEKSQVVAKLLRLKRHEVPAPGFEARTAARVRERIATEKPRPTSTLAFEWMTGGLQGWQVAAMAAAAAVVVAAGIFLAVPGKPADPTFAVQGGPAASAREPVNVPAMVAPIPRPDDPAWQKPIVLLDDRGPMRRPLVPMNPAELSYGSSETTSVPAQFTLPERIQE